ncbi:MAG: cytochrome c, partial [Verrucomicrobiales bacterium]
LAQFQDGKTIYESICIGCHQADGNGLNLVAPPLRKSEWVTGDPVRAIKIVLCGLEGPITVAGKTYQVPDIQPVMPGLKDSPEFDDQKLAAVLTYVRNAWGNKASPVAAKDVSAQRAILKDRSEPFAAEDLQ